MRNPLSVLLLTVFSAAIAIGQSQDSITGKAALMPQLSFSAPYFGAMPGFGGAPLTGRPYSGEQISEMVQTLADGTHINRTMHLWKVYRDAQGRTRTERTLMQGPSTQASPLMIDISDPVAQVRYNLDTQNKVAHRMDLSAMGHSIGTAGTFAAIMPAPQVPPPALSNWIATGGFMGAMIPPPPSSSTPQIARQVNPSPQGNTSMPRTVTEKLDPQTIERVAVEGTRHTMTWPVGIVGNDREFVTTNEVWMSPELKIMVLSKSSDPRSGDNTQKLINISRDEPDPSLFQPPSDYTVVDDKPQLGMPMGHTRIQPR